jgi:hypothetical protein
LRDYIINIDNAQAAEESKVNNAQRIAQKATETGGNVAIGAKTAEVEVNGVVVLSLPVTPAERIELSQWMDATDGFADSDE